MTLAELADSFSIVASVATVFVALWVFLWTRRNEANNQLRHGNNEMQSYNLTVLGDDRLLEMEAENHPFGEIELEDARKMYRYFLWMNVADNIRRASKAGLLDKNYAEARFTNQARIAFPDREFLEAHVFPRGYEPDLIEAFRKRWSKMDGE